MRTVAAVAVGVALLVPAAALGAKPAGKVYTGTSSAQTKVGFRLVSGQVKSFAIGYVAQCDDGETLRGTYRFRPTKVASAEFSVRGPSTGALPDGRATSSKLRLAGRFSGTRARGTFSIITQMARLEGGGVATCRSGRTTWSAAR